MRKHSTAFAGALALLLLGSASPVFADSVVIEDMPPSAIGIAVSVGGGVAGFRDEDLRATTDVGGLWDVRAVIGTRSLLALEAAYVGTAQAIDSRIGDERSATLIGTGAEAAVRLNVLPFMTFTPYVFGGVGYKRYDVRGADFTTADTGIADEDTLLEIPLGGGLSYRYDRFLVDARFTYRIATGEDLVLSASDTGDLDVDTGALAMDTWSGAARVGVEF